MKRLVLVIFVLLCAMNSFSQAVTLDESIALAADYLGGHLDLKTTLAVYNFNSDSGLLSDHIINELAIALANAGMNVVDRYNLSIANQEIYYNRQGTIDENTIQDFGREIGAQTVIFGAFTKSGAEYRLRIQAISVETKRILTGRNFQVKEDPALLSLMGLTEEKQYRFTSQQKTQAGFENILYGWGSFKMGDPLGGATVLVPEIASMALLTIGIVKMAVGVAEAADEENYNDVYYGSIMEINAAKEKAKNAAKQKAVDEAVPFIVVGGIGLVASWTWGFIRPYLYDRPTMVKKTAFLDNFHMDLLPMSAGSPSVKLTYTHRF